ncbi:MAG: helix-turn-helix transcriptional regulator [Fimbriimonadaceae bacterium]|nr:helix-turn-helix transcriptional regulator [Fimbriimonadaceae bacterium]
MKVPSGGRSRNREIRTIERERLFESTFSVWQCTAEFDEPFMRHLQVQEGWLWAGVCIAGAVIVPGSSHERFLCHHSHMFAGQGSLNAYLAYGRGRHTWIEIESPIDEMRVLQSLDYLKAGATTFSTVENVVQWDDARSDTGEGAGIRWVSMLLDALSHGNERDRRQHSDSPIAELTRSVMDDPAHPWTLQEAAYQAGYSPFHLSRAFKSQVGVGFPVFVQRCRAQAAFRYIVSGTESADTIARACGFGQAHAMRVALKEFCGFLPNEIRAADVGFA